MNIFKSETAISQHSQNNHGNLLQFTKKVRVRNMTMYIRLKRKNQTVFLHVEPSNTFAQIKQRTAEIFAIDASHIMLYASDKVYLNLILNSK